MYYQGAVAEDLNLLTEAYPITALNLDRHASELGRLQWKCKKNVGLFLGHSLRKCGWG